MLTFQRVKLTWIANDTPTAQLLEKRIELRAYGKVQQINLPPDITSSPPCHVPSGAARTLERQLSAYLLHYGNIYINGVKGLKFRAISRARFKLSFLPLTSGSIRNPKPLALEVLR
jgi:hypothetical protein